MAFDSDRFENNRSTEPAEDPTKKVRPFLDSANAAACWSSNGADEIMEPSGEFYDQRFVYVYPKKNVNHAHAVSVVVRILAGYTYGNVVNLGLPTVARNFQRWRKGI